MISGHLTIALILSSSQAPLKAGYAVMIRIKGYSLTGSYPIPSYQFIWHHDRYGPPRQMGQRLHAFV